MTLQEKLNLVTNYFAEDWAIEKAMQLLEDYEKMLDAQQPAPSAASKAVLAAIRAANMQLVQTGDDEFMLVTLKQATPHADSQPAPVVDKCTKQQMTTEVLTRMQQQEDGHNKNPFRPLLERLMRNEGGYSTTEIGQLKYALDGFYGAARAPADSVTAPHSEPWYGHQFKEVRRGYWQCSCGKAIAEAVPSASKDSYPPLPNRYAYDDDGGEMFTTDQMRAYVDADRKQGESHDWHPNQR